MGFLAEKVLACSGMTGMITILHLPLHLISSPLLLWLPLASRDALKQQGVPEQEGQGEEALSSIYTGNLSPGVSRARSWQLGTKELRADNVGI